MLCNIADLIVEVPAVGGMASRCRDYEIREKQNGESTDISICADLYRHDIYPGWSESNIAYMESGWQFYGQLLKFDGLYLHASAVELNGKAYLFSGPCGMGKSTHTQLWKQVWGEKAQIFNDDKPALRRLDNHWYAYGTPWCGKDGININMKVPLAGICFLKRGERNSIRRLDGVEAIALILTQTLRKFKNGANTTMLLDHLDKLVREIPIYELENRPEPAAAQLSYETMCQGAEEAGL